MTEFIEQVFSTIFGNNVILATILISIVPIIEIKGAIPFGMSVSIWGNVALSSLQALLFSLIGSCLIVPVLALIYLPIINALKRSKLFRKIALKIEEKVNRSKNKIENRAENVTSQNEVETNKKDVNKNSNATVVDNNLDNGTINADCNKDNVDSSQDNKVTNESNIKISSDLNKTNNSLENTTNVNSVNIKQKTSNLKIQESVIISEVKTSESTQQTAQNKTSIFKRTQPYNKTFFIKLLCVFLFVSVPLPLTGVWTGTCVAVMLGLGFWWSCLSVILGNVVAGILVTLVASIPGFDSIYIVYAVLIFIAVLLLIGLIKKLVNKNKKQN